MATFFGALVSYGRKVVRSGTGFKPTTPNHEVSGVKTTFWLRVWAKKKKGTTVV
jgi:hypothetical protein